MSVATSYAKALCEAALESKASSSGLDQIENELALILSVIEGSKEAKVALLSPVTTSKEKSDLVQDIGGKLKLSPLVLQFLVLLAKKGRFPLLPEVRTAFKAVRLASEGGVAGQLVAAEPISEADLDSLSKAFSHKLGKKVAFQVSTDPSLLAGVKVTVNGVTYDGTLRSQLQKLRDRFVTGSASAHA